MWRRIMIVACLTLSGCATYRSVSGRVYGPDDGALDEALRDSGSASLQCDPSQVQVRSFTPQGYRYREKVLMAEGCGQRASYVVECPHHLPALSPCPSDGNDVPSSTCNQEREARCELVLISKVALD
jgi:hypothetical protein